MSAKAFAGLIAVFGVWVGWLLIDAVGRKIVDLTEIRPGRLDAIFFSLVLGALRLVLVCVAAMPVLFFVPSPQIHVKPVIEPPGYGSLDVAALKNSDVPTGRNVGSVIVA